MATLHVPAWFDDYRKKLAQLDEPCTRVLNQKLREIATNPFGGIQLTDLARLPPPRDGLAANIRSLFEEDAPGSLSGLPEKAIWVAFGEVLLEGKKPPPRPTYTCVIYIPEGLPPNGIVLAEYFPASIATDVAAILVAPVWVRGDRLLIDPMPENE